MRYLVGVDGGNSKTLAAVGDETGRILGVGRAGGGNHQNKGLEGAMAAIRSALDGALQSASLVRSEVECSYYALAGADLPEDFELLRPALGSLEYGVCTGLDNDTAASLRSGTDAPNAVVVGWGAGTNALGKNAAGDEIRLPALGEISGDWGGGGDLATEAIRLVARAHDGRGAATALTGLVLQALQVPTVDDMIRGLYFSTIDRACLLQLPPLVFKAANQGDPVACELVARAACEVTITAIALLRRLGLMNTPADVVLAGSVFRAEGSLFIDSIAAELRARAPLARIVMPDVEPVVGAYFCALDLLGIPVDADLRALARTTYRERAGEQTMKGRS
jgi:N-acetylglucosamine kinase-like BadF-type ATPase